MDCSFSSPNDTGFAIMALVLATENYLISSIMTCYTTPMFSIFHLVPSSSLACFLVIFMMLKLLVVLPAGGNTCIGPDRYFPVFKIMAFTCVVGLGLDVLLEI
ncbi:hypothetical protein NC652_019002 [Populus alba x Populus x berolinensis]|nr:hypothetical protein NC652_019002 [Populus alba x Populus x berolinensis]